jgi:uncharacterized ferredoxin-like protein
MSPTIESGRGEREAVLEVARLMLTAARTAPKSGGVDNIVACIVYDEDKDLIAKEMERIAEERKNEGFRRDARNVGDSEAVVLIGVRGTKNVGMDCGACGCQNCEEFSKTDKRMGKDFVGPNCIFKALDLGIALGSAVKTASLMNVDNRIMYRAGAAAMKLNLLPEAAVVMGVPVSAKGKSIYFDRLK